MGLYPPGHGWVGGGFEDQPTIGQNLRGKPKKTPKTTDALPKPSKNLRGKQKKNTKTKDVTNYRGPSTRIRVELDPRGSAWI